MVIFLILYCKPFIKPLQDLQQPDSNDGILSLHDDLFMSVRWLSGPMLPEVVWKKFSATGAFRNAFDHALLQIKNRRCMALHADFELMTVLDSDDQAWLRTEWLPKAAVGGLKHIGVVLPAASIGKTSLMKGLRAPDGGALEIGYFMHREQSREWILRMSRLHRSSQ